MNKVLGSLAFASVALQASADCPNACSGHGLCREHDACSCDPNYMGADCSQRVCPFGLAFVDTPRGDLNHNGVLDNDGYSSVAWSNVQEYEVFPTDANIYASEENEAHFYAECSGKGSCDRSSGACKCIPGYTGSSCQRTTCPSDCSGHGVCRTLREIAGTGMNARVSYSAGGHNVLSGVTYGFDYDLWDADKHQGCICDPGFAGFDCSQRLCPRGDDPLTIGSRWCGGTTCTWEIQSFTLPKSLDLSLKITVADVFNRTYVAYTNVNTQSSEFGLGPVAPSLQATKLPGPLTVAGKIMDAIRNIPGGLFQRVEVYPKAPLTDILDDDANVIFAQTNDEDALTFRVTFTGVTGDLPLLKVTDANGNDILDVNTDDADEEEVVYEFAIGNYEGFECSKRGLCDSARGTCKCFSGFTGAACEHQNALAM